MGDEHPEPSRKSHGNFLHTAFPDLFGRDGPKLDMHKGSPGVERQQQHDPAQPQLDHDTKTALQTSKGYTSHGDPSTMPSRTPEEEQAYLAALANWAKEKDTMRPGDGTFGAGYNVASAGDTQGLMLGAVSDEQMQRDTTVRRKDGTWDVPPSKGSDVGFVGTWKRRLSSPFNGKERRASADARAAEYAREHSLEHGHAQDPVSRLKDEA